MSVVYMARNERANRTWAIKEIRKDRTENFDIMKQGLLMEIDMLRRFQHPHLPGIIDVIDQEESFLIVMDFIEGRTLSDILKESGAQPQEDVINWAKQLCDVLGYLHSRDPAVIYRDMKPSNVMLKPDGNVVLLDFGTAREHKVSGMEDTICLGTRGYAAPEQYGGFGQTDKRTDIYCLGATMYHLLTGHNPGQPPYEMYPIRRWNPNLSAGLEAIILKCTRNDPAERYQSCAELYYALENYEKWDVKFRKSQKAKLQRFMIPTALAVLFGLGAAGFKGAEAHLTRYNYNAFLTAARNSATKEEEIGNYRKAIDLEPGRSEGYVRLLQEGFLDDQVLTLKESEQLRSVLISYGNGRNTNEMELKKSPKEYGRFAYEAGIAYYYKFEEKSSKKNAKGYFEAAAASGFLEGRQLERAKRLYVISDYYSRIGIADETGDAPVTYRDYWDDLTKLSAGNLVETDNERTALIMYQELAVQIVAGAADFKNAGVTQEEMNTEIFNIKEHLQRDFENVSEGNKEAVKQELQELKRAVRQAERMVRSAFEKTEREAE